MEVQTGNRFQIIDLTSQVEEELRRSNVRDGICLVYTPHTTTAVVVNEAEPGLLQDMLDKMRALVPESPHYRHGGDGNAHAHIQAALLGNSAVIPVERGSLLLGTWQRVLFLELDGPRRRRVMVKVLPGAGE
ncbi:MAG: YjbQ family protein [Methanosarcinales archaeon]|nr:YjbQ family protein [Methanosarcinales archaeon]